MVVTNTETGTPGASDATMPPTAAISANTTDAVMVATGEENTRAAAAAGVMIARTVRRVRLHLATSAAGRATGRAAPAEPDAVDVVVNRASVPVVVPTELVATTRTS